MRSLACALMRMTSYLSVILKKYIYPLFSYRNIRKHVQRLKNK